eukprot:scaffold51615_cov19-Prasinocladus_malaysianus.AAC.1
MANSKVVVISTGAHQNLSARTLPSMLPSFPTSWYKIIYNWSVVVRCVNQQKHYDCKEFCWKSECKYGSSGPALNCAHASEAKKQT